MANTIDLSGTLAAIEFTNPYKGPADDKVDQVFNTGLSAVGEPHSDEEASLAGKAIIPDVNAWEAKHIASIRLFGKNEYVQLNPGDTLKILPKSADEAIYYLNMPDTDIFKIVNRGTFVKDASSS